MDGLNDNDKKVSSSITNVPNLRLEYKTIPLFKVAEHSFDTSVSFTFYSKILDSLVAKNGSKQHAS